MAQAVIRSHFRVEVRVRSQLILFEICGGQNSKGTGTSLTTLGFSSASVIPPMLHTPGSFIDFIHS